MRRETKLHLPKGVIPVKNVLEYVCNNFSNFPFCSLSKLSGIFGKQFGFAGTYSVSCHIFSITIPGYVLVNDPRTLFLGTIIGSLNDFITHIGISSSGPVLTKTTYPYSIFLLVFLISFYHTFSTISEPVYLTL